MDRKLLRSLITVILTCLSFASLVSSTANKKTGTCCSDGLGLNYTLPMFMECKEELHPNGSMVQKIPKLIPYSEKEAAACPRRKNKLGIKPGHRVCRFPDCDSNPCVNGWCEETMENYKCHCPAGYNGRRCSQKSSTSAPSAKPTTADSEQPSTPQPSCQHPAMSTTSTDSTTMSETMTTSTMVSETTSTAVTDPTLSSTMSADPTGSTTTQEASTMGSPTSDTTVTSGSTATQAASAIGSTTTVTSESSTTQKPSTTSSTTTKAATTLASSTDEESAFISTTDSTTSGSATVSPTTQDATTMSTTMESTTSNPTTTGEPTQKIFVTDEGTNNIIFVADLQDQLSFTSIPSTSEPRFITYDSVDKKIYWTDEGEKRVFRADVDGGNRQTVTQGNDDRRGIAIAETSRTLYIANKGLKTIISMSIGEGSPIPGDETVFVGPESEEPISLEVAEGYLYWTEKYRIRRKPLNGGAVEDLHTDPSLSELYGLSIGPSSGDYLYIFLCDFGEERSFYLEVSSEAIYSTELTNDLTAPGYDKPREKLRDITYFEGVLYWTKEADPSSITVMTDYQSARSYEIKETSGIITPYQLLITAVSP